MTPQCCPLVSTLTLGSCALSLTHTICAIINKTLQKSWHWGQHNMLSHFNFASQSLEYMPVRPGRENGSFCQDGYSEAESLQLVQMSFSNRRGSIWRFAEPFSSALPFSLEQMTLINFQKSNSYSFFKAQNSLCPCHKVGICGGHCQSMHDDQNRSHVLGARSQMELLK